MRNYLSYLSTPLALICLFLLGSIIASVSFITLHPTVSQSASQYSLVWSDEFNGSSVDSSKWTVVNQTRSTESHHQGRYQTANVTVRDGNAQIITKRHCVTGSELPSASNQSTAPCPNGTTTRYSSGQIKTDYNWQSGKMEIRAKLPKTDVSGLWSGYWLRNQSPWCTPTYGEIDILEWYSDPKSTNASTATTHVVCQNDKLKSRQHVKKVNGSLADTWHTWGVEWNAEKVTYYLDGEIVGSITSHRPNDSDQNSDTYSDYDGVTKEQFTRIMNEPWQLRINTQVYPENDQWHEAPNNSRDFAPQTFLVDYVRVYKKQDATTSATSSAPPAASSPQPSTTQSTPSRSTSTQPEPSTPVSRDTITTTTVVNTESTPTNSERDATDTNPIQSSNDQTAKADTKDSSSHSQSTPEELPQTGFSIMSVVIGAQVLALIGAFSAWVRSLQHRQF
ncbi:glycoside hydrolase family 16 protein [Candidatus Saccharibacteria bacterium]|nr:glycoside hydrolase family 16 protein [Candidatus Saccharibacteria bacterium]